MNRIFKARIIVIAFFYYFINFLLQISSFIYDLISIINGDIMKDKKSKEEIKQGPGQFYYETIGMISLIIAVVIIAKLGTVGSFLTIFLKVLFGDWYLLIVIIIMIFGVYLILNHHGFNFKNQRFLGYLFCVFAILMLTHFSVHNYIVNEEGSYFSNTWMHYKNFISTKIDTYLGGGLIGAVLFYIMYSLLSTFGVVLVSLILIILGFTMIINKPITEIGTVFLKFFKKVGKFHKSFNDFFKYEIGKKENELLNIYQVKRKLTLKNLDEYKNIDFLYSQEKYLEEIKSLVYSVFNNLNINYRLLNSFSSYSSSLLTFQIYDEYDCNILGSKLSSLIEESIFISKIGISLNIEINNKYISILSLRDLLIKQPMLYNNYLIPIGLNIKNQIEEIDFSKEGNLLIIGDFNTGIKSFVSSIILSSILKITIDNIEYNLFDDLGEFNDYHYLFKNINNGDIKEYLNDIINLIDERVNILSLKNVHQIDEYNVIIAQEKNEYLKRIVYVIELDDFNNNYDYRFIDDKIMYIIQVGRDVGVYIIFISRNIRKISTILFSLFKYRIIYNTGNIDSNLIETKHAQVLNNKGDCLFYRENIIKRIQTPKFTIEELNKIKKEIK